MLFERVEDALLSHYSFIVGCPGAGVAAVVDPKRDVDEYLELARHHGVRITHVLETHIPADYASGARELAARTGAELWLSGHDTGELYEYQFDHHAMVDGDELRLGNVRLQAVFTPGHTPEHLCFLVYDGLRSKHTPLALLSGDFLFVGSVGRPDLLGDDAMNALAGRVFESVQGPLAALPAGTEVHPAHGAGSL